MQAQGRGHAIGDLVQAGRAYRPVGGHIDESGDDVLSGGVEGPLAAQRLAGDGHDRTALDANVHRRVQAALRIDHRATGDDDVVDCRALSSRRRREQQRCKNQE